MKIVAVFDKKSGLFDNPVACRHAGEALRDFENLKKKPETKFGANPEDYELMLIGEWDYSTGRMENVPHVTLSSGV